MTKSRSLNALNQAIAHAQFSEAALCDLIGALISNEPKDRELSPVTEKITETITALDRAMIRAKASMLLLEDVTKMRLQETLKETSKKGLN